MLRHGQAEFGDGGFAVPQQAAPKAGVGPGTGNDLGAVGRHPVLFGDPGELFDKPTRDQIAFPECPLQRRHAVLGGRRCFGRLSPVIHEPNLSC